MSASYYGGHIISQTQSEIDSDFHALCLQLELRRAWNDRPFQAIIRNGPSPKHGVEAKRLCQNLSLEHCSMEMIEFVFARSGSRLVFAIS